MTTQEKLARLRGKMAREGIDAYIIPSADAHQSEYVADYWKSRAWISGFTGSAGTVIITGDKALLWTDGRYTIQAAREIEGSGFELLMMHTIGVPTPSEWLCANLPNRASIGFDGRTVSVKSYDEMAEILNRKNVRFRVDVDLVGEIWTDRPMLPGDRAYEHLTDFAGKSRLEKLAEVRAEMKKLGVESYLLASLDDLAWLFNYRGNDVYCTPVAYAYAYITQSEAVLLMDMAKPEGPLKESLSADGIRLLPYEDAGSYIRQTTIEGAVLINPDRISVYMKSMFPQGARFTETMDITTNLKAVKNTVEIENIYRSQRRDGVAMVRFLRWIKEAVGKQTLEEADIHDKLQEFRGMGQFYKGPSFPTIAAYMDNAAQMHYSPVKSKSTRLAPKGFLLVDSGGQYLDGTTDITRTIALGELNTEMRQDFTIVLKSHISLARVKFLYGANGGRLDYAARKPMWDRGLDYKCGTGHGVGYMLSVHEGPHGFGVAAAHARLEAGMIVTNEPGIYKENNWGIRTENTLLVQEDYENENGRFMRFDTISYCPIDLDAIEPSLLTAGERLWLNDYHEETYQVLAPFLEEDERKWLRDQTRAI